VDCNNFSDTDADRGAGTAAFNYLSNCWLVDVNNFSTADVLANLHLANGRGGGAGTTPALLEATATWDPGNLVDGAGETSAGITVAGAALGDWVLVTAPYDVQDCVVSGYVQAADTVEIRLQNESGGARDLASGTWRVRVVKP
jgi:hypothetical protein